MNNKIQHHKNLLTRTIENPSKMKEERFKEGMKRWIGYWRKNPHRFVTEYLNIQPFSTFQMILLYLMFQNNNVVWWASRGLGKSFLTALYCVVRCILFPGTIIAMTSGTKGQAIEIISKKIPELLNKAPLLQYEIKEFKALTNDAYVEFFNGSRISVVTPGDNARGNRAHVLVVDEFRMVDVEVVDMVLKKFLTINRTPDFLNKPEYENRRKEFIEPNTTIYMSSAWYKSHWSWGRFLSTFEGMIKGKKYFTCGLPYQLGVKEGIITPQIVQEELDDENFNLSTFQMEMECIPFGEAEKAFFTYRPLEKVSTIKVPYLPIDDIDYIKTKGDLKRNRFYKKRLPGEVRVMGVDVAMMAGTENDETVFTFMRCVPSGNRYYKFIEYSEALQGKHSDIQALRLKQLFYDLECDFCAMDTQGNGISLYDSVVRVTEDSDRGVTYPAWTAFNNDKMDERSVFDTNAVRLIYSVKGTPAINHDIHTYVKSNIDKGTLKLIIDEYGGNEYIRSQKVYSKEETVKIRAQYIQSKMLVTQMINLEQTSSSGFIKLEEPSGMRKDRYMSLGYAMYFIKSKESELASSANSSLESFLKAKSNHLRSPKAKSRRRPRIGRG